MEKPAERKIRRVKANPAAQSVPGPSLADPGADGILAQRLQNTSLEKVMLELIIDNLRSIGPFFAGIWGLTVALTLLRPQRYLNSMLLMLSLLTTMVFAAGFFGRETGSHILLACFVLIMLMLLLVPALLIVNGVWMIRRESAGPAHLLSLGLGVAVGIGEIAAAVYVLGLAGTVNVGHWDLWVLLTAATVFYFSFLVLCFVLYSVFIRIMPHRMDFDYVIIHGCGLSGGNRMTKLLSDRVDKAIRVYGKCAKKPFIIPSGGQGSDESVSESGAMTDYLIAHGVPADRILPEDRSATTRENLLYSKQIIDNRQSGGRVALVSSNYHIYRCLLLARDVGLKCTGIGADVALYFWPSALIREFIAVFVSRRFFPWAVLGYLLFVSPIVFALIRQRG